uniref:(northern house mosquito) hypothetical protein n=1 Tax=Culex pipiens TaxID=7175 RepID=A0A8D8CQA0_CULPI
MPLVLDQAGGNYKRSMGKATKIKPVVSLRVLALIYLEIPQGHTGSAKGRSLQFWTGRVRPQDIRRRIFARPEHPIRRVDLVHRVHHVSDLRLDVGQHALAELLQVVDHIRRRDRVPLVVVGEANIPQRAKGSPAHVQTVGALEHVFHLRDHLANLRLDLRRELFGDLLHVRLDVFGAIAAEAAEKIKDGDGNLKCSEQVDVTQSHTRTLINESN